MAPRRLPPRAAPVRLPPPRGGRTGRPTPLGLLGGTFNPPHAGHLHAARAARAALGLARVVLVPAGRPPHKPAAELAPARHRLAMTRLAVRSHPELSVSAAEIRRPGPSYTVDTVRAFRRAQRGREVVVVIGADTLPEIPTWHRWRELLNLARFAVVARPGHRLGRPPARPDRFVPVRVQGVDVSATRLRARLARGLPCGRALPPAVAAYIRRHGLYGAPRRRRRRG